MKLAAAYLITAIGLTACATTPYVPLTLENPFDPAAFEWAAKPGTGRIDGTALLRTVGGDVKTCAGLATALIPATPHTDELMRRTFNQGGNLATSTPTFANADPVQIGKVSRGTICDAQGAFSFTDLPAGTYYVLSTVTWGAVKGGRYPYIATQGGKLVQRVTLADGEARKVVLTE